MIQTERIAAYMESLRALRAEIVCAADYSSAIKYATVNQSAMKMVLSN